MNTAGIQNYLSNVFRPIVFYDTTASIFVPKLEMSNIDNYSGNTITVFTAGVGDSASNVYVGKEAGNVYNVTQACCNVTAVGYGAGSNISNVSNSAFLGFRAGADSKDVSDVVAIGYNAGIGPGGSSNILIGSGTTSGLGSSNVFIGHGITGSNVSNQLLIGLNSKTPIAANLSTNWVGLAGSLTPLDVGNKLDVCGNVRIQGQLGINITPGTRTMDVNGNFRAQDSSTNVLDFSNGVTLSSKGVGSLRGSITVPTVATTIGQLRKGVVLISAVNQSDSADYASRMVLAYTTSNAVDVGSNVAAGDASITFSTSNIQITDTVNSNIYDYSITYFPLP